MEEGNSMGEVIAVHGKDYLMGASEAMLNWLEEQGQAFPREWFADETPERSVSVDAFLIDKNLVTNGEFSDFCKATGHVTEAEKWAQSSLHRLLGRG